MECTFYSRIGACRHGEKCSKKHVKPTRSNTILLANLYPNPKVDKNEQDLNPKQILESFENFYKDIFIRLSKIDQVVKIVVCENVNNHLNGNVYCRFKTEEGAKNAVYELNQEWYAGKPVYCELTSVKNFLDANCRDYDNNSCTREYCNFMHVIRPSAELQDQLFKSQQKSLLLRRINLIKSQLDQPQEPEIIEQPKIQGDFKSTVEALFSLGQKS